MCGIIGLSLRSAPACYDLYDGLLMLQHRGQDAAGMVTFDGRKFHAHKANGLVRDVFTPSTIATLPGSVGLGHVRYPTAGTADALEAQPFFVNAPLGIYLIHNGNLTNTRELKNLLDTHYHRYLQTDSDTELLLNVFADELYTQVKGRDRTTDTLRTAVFTATEQLMQHVTGAYSVITLIDDLGLFAFRDPKGIRPLVLGHRKTVKGDEYCFASEDVALKALGFTLLRDVAPGEAILIDHDGQLHSHQCAEGSLEPCIFEYVYLARPDSMLNGISVYKTQLRMGSALAQQVAAADLPIDVVIPVPDSSRPVAMQLAQDLSLTYREGLIKNRYVGRTFIMPDQTKRKKSIRQKLNPVELEIKDKNILLVDDSIVRGNTMKAIVQMCRDAGAQKVFVASGAPAVRFPDVYGVDIPTRRELVAHGLTTEQIAEVLGVDALFYQTVPDLIAAAQAGNPDIRNFCTGCFDGGYVTPEVTPDYLDWVEHHGRGCSAPGSTDSLLTL